MDTRCVTVFFCRSRSLQSEGADHSVALKWQRNNLSDTLHYEKLFIHFTSCMISHTHISGQALSLAVQYGREEAVLKLLQLGADKTLRTKAGKSPADLAVTFKHTQVPDSICIPDTT